MSVLTPDGFLGDVVAAFTAPRVTAPRVIAPSPVRDALRKEYAALRIRHDALSAEIGQVIKRMHEVDAELQAHFRALLIDKDGLDG